MAETETFDYVIVGAGSAGAVLAHRLTEDPDTSVLLLEAGPMDYSVFIHMPAAFAEPLKGRRYNWAFKTEPEPHMDDRVMDQPRGKALGGSSSINGMAYIRGNAGDYDGWADLKGLDGWAYRHCLPYFKKAETHELGGDAYHGDSGPLYVTRGKCENPLPRAWIEAGQQAGYGHTPDMNGERNEGVGPMDRTTKDGLRWSTANAYLRPVWDRPNLTVRTRAFTERILVEKDTAVGVRYTKGDATHDARAAREVLCCAGAIQSPQLLQVSGIGPADRLRGIGVDVVADLPGVGENLQDHLECYIQERAKEPVSLYPVTRLVKRTLVGIQWLTTRRGLGGSNHFEAGGFIRSEAGIKWPNIQYHFLPVAVNYDGTGAAPYHGYQAHVGPMRPESRGHVRAQGPDMRHAPAIRFNYNQTERDLREMRDSIRLTREILRQPAFERYREKELAPGDDVQSDAEIDAFIRAEGESAYHPCGTCAMGDGEGSVVDGEGRVHGVAGLRVVDASIMPTIPSGNLNAPTIMLAEKLADAIRGRDPLPPENPPIWIHPHWQTTQR